MSKITNQSFNDSELSKGFHLLTESAHTVKVNTPSVPPSTAHLYPRLAGSDWTCYISEPRIVLGRSGTVNPGQKRTRKDQIVHVDFEGSNLVSRRHCEIRFSARRERWELYVYGRNGVKINHVEKKPRDKPTVLKTSSLIEINDTIFVFILPENFIQPRYPSQRGDDGTDSEITTPNDHTDLGVDDELETAIISLFKNHAYLDTREILTELKKTLNKPIEKETLLHLLVISPKFHLAPNSIAMSSKESDQAKWTLIPPTSPNLDREKEPVTIVQSSGSHGLIKDTNPTNDHSAELPPALLPSVSLSRLFNNDMDDGDWSVFMPDSPLDPSNEKPAEPDSLEAPCSLEVLSSFETPSLEEPSSLEWENTTPNDFNTSHPLSLENGNVNETEEPAIPPLPPVLFKGLSIESMYSIWTSSASSLLTFEDEVVDASSSTKRLKQTNSDGSSSSIINSNTNEDDVADTMKADIYKEIHTKIII